MESGHSLGSSFKYTLSVGCTISDYYSRTVSTLGGRRIRRWKHCSERVKYSNDIYVRLWLLHIMRKNTDLLAECAKSVQRLRVRSSSSPSIMCMRVCVCGSMIPVTLELFEHNGVNIEAIKHNV